MPMIKVPRLLMQGRAMEDKVVGRFREDLVHTATRLREDRRQKFELLLLTLFEVGGMPLWKNPHLKWKPWRKGRQAQKLGIIRHDAVPRRKIVFKDVAVNTAFFLLVVGAASADFVDDAGWNHRQRDQLGMAVFERGPGRRTMVLENQNVPQTQIFFQVDDAITVGPQHVLDPSGGHVGQAVFMPRRFNDYFMRTDAVHSIV